jgi:hypothetical protein
MSNQIIWSRSMTLTQNVDCSFSWGFSNLAPTVPPSPYTAAVPYSFGGTTVKWTLKEANIPASPTLAQLTSTSGAITFGTATVKGAPVATVNWTVPNATTVGLPVGDWWFDLLWIIDSQQLYLAAGLAVVQGTGGR